MKKLPPEWLERKLAILANTETVTFENGPGWGKGGSGDTTSAKVLKM